MADTGYNWDAAWTFALDGGGGDWNAEAIADDGQLQSSASINLDGKAACEVGLILLEDDTGDITGDVTVYVLGSAGGMAIEEIEVGSPYSFTITPVRNDTIPKRFSVDPGSFSEFTIGVLNESGQELAVSVKYKCATIPPAS